MSNPRGYGALRAPIKDEPIGDPQVEMVRLLRAIKARAVPQPIWRRIDVSLSAGEFQGTAYNDEPINSMTVTVSTGIVYVFEGSTNNAGQKPDYIFSAADSRQIALAPGAYQFTFYSAAGAEAIFKVGNL